MKNRDYIRFIILSVSLAMLLSFASLVLMNKINESNGSKFKSNFFVFLAQSIEQRLQGTNLEELKNLPNPLAQHFTPGGPDFGPSGFRPPHGGPFPPGPGFGPPGFNPPPGAHFPPPPPSPGGIFGDRPPGGPGGPHHMGPDLWIVSESGTPIFSFAKSEFPLNWAITEKPNVPHVITEDADFFRLLPSVTIIKLDTKVPLYLVVKDPRPIFPFIMGQALIVFLTVTAAFLLSLTFLFLYLRRKSQEARSVLGRLGQGDLKARFTLKRLDELGGLLIDFNRMADQIEHLVKHVRETETIRKNLVQELGHDLRTPLTAMRTSIDTLRIHFDSVSPDERKELFSLIDDEIRYFHDLIEKLMLISSLDEPNFKDSAEIVNVKELLESELKARKSSSHLSWFLTNGQTKNLLVQGNLHLLQRLFKNAFDNAAKYATGRVEIFIAERDSQIEIQIADDGSGLKDEEIQSFGKRQTYRMRRVQEGLNFSLGLGSVIMKSITELHGGQLSVSNILKDDEIIGARLTILLPKSLSEDTSKIEEVV